MTFADMVSLVGADDGNKAKIWLNEAYLSLSEAADILDKSEPMVLNPIYEVYELPDNMYKLKRIEDDEGEEIFKANRNKVTVQAGQEPTLYYKEGKYLGFNGDTGTVYLWFFKYPNKMVNDADEPVKEIPERFHMALVNLAKARQKEEDDQTADGFYYHTQLESAKKELRVWKSNDDSAPETVEDVY